MSGSRHSRRPVRAAIVAVASVAAGGGAPSLAYAAPSVSVPAKCYVSWPLQGSQPIPLVVRGLTPGAPVKVELQVGGTTVSGLPMLAADAAGAIDTELGNWTSGLGDGTTRATPSKVVVSDVATGTPIASAAIDVANVGLDVDVSRKAYGTQRRWVISGLATLGGGSTYYAYYFRHDKLVGRQKIGRATDDCGYLKTRRPLVPFKRTGTFRYKVQASPTYDAGLAWIGGTVRQGRRK